MHSATDRLVGVGRFVSPTRDNDVGRDRVQTGNVGTLELKWRHPLYPSDPEIPDSIPSIPSNARVTPARVMPVLNVSQSFAHSSVSIGRVTSLEHTPCSHVRCASSTISIAWIRPARPTGLGLRRYFNAISRPLRVDPWRCISRGSVRPRVSVAPFKQTRASHTQCYIPIVSAIRVVVSSVGIRDVIRHLLNFIPRPMPAHRATYIAKAFGQIEFRGQIITTN